MTQRAPYREYRQSSHPLLLDLEHAIRIANREIIHKRVPDVSSDTVLQLAIVVARLRAVYLEHALKLTNTDTPPDAVQIAALAEHRMAYDEARHAFDALRRAIERGYVAAADEDGTEEIPATEMASEDR